ncbi:MAG: RHS repeat-associated core domain-containing protein [Fimbriimonadaceae bacterium]
MDSSGNTANLNVFAPDGLIARKEGSTWTYYTFDPQGNVVHKLNSSNNPTAARLLDAWGAGVETTLPRNVDPWGYNAKWGYYYDRETALYYCQNRMYDASTGRWLNRDPIGAAGGMNVYGYCGNGAVGQFDRTGALPQRNAEAMIIAEGNLEAAGNYAAAARMGKAFETAVGVARNVKTAYDIYNLVAPVADVGCEIVEGAGELGDPPDWEQEPLPSRTGKPAGPGRPSKVPRREQHPATRESIQKGMVDTLQPQRDTSDECDADLDAAQRAIFKLRQRGEISNREYALLMIRANRNYTNCISGLP